MQRPGLYRDPNILTWSLLAGLVATCLVLGHAMGFGIAMGRAILPAVGIAVLAAGVVTGRRWQRPRLAAAATALLQMTLFTIAGVVLAYLLAARAAPLWDGQFAAADRRLGLDWPQVFAAADRLPASLLTLAGVAYHSLTVQMVATVLILAHAGHRDRLRQAIAAAILAGIVTILLSGVMPALGNLFDPDRYRHLWPSVAWRDQGLIAGLRDGTLRQVDLSQMTGIVSFPSYHATLPVILVWALRPAGWLFRPAAAWAAVTIAATPLFGGHYAVDVLAGLVLAPAAIAATRWISARHLDVADRCPTSPRLV